MLKMSIEQQFRLFLYLCAFGLTAGFFFDFFKAWSKVFNFSRKTTFLVDFCFCLISALSFFYLLLCTNRGEIRFYTFTALLIGVLLYYNFGSTYFYKEFLALFQNIKCFGKNISKKARSWQESIRKRRTVYKDRLACWKRFFRKED